MEKNYWSNLAGILVTYFDALYNEDHLIFPAPSANPLVGPANNDHYMCSCLEKGKCSHDNTGFLYLLTDISLLKEDIYIDNSKVIQLLREQGIITGLKIEQQDNTPLQTLTKMSAQLRSYINITVQHLGKRMNTLLYPPSSSFDSTSPDSATSSSFSTSLPSSLSNNLSSTEYNLEQSSLLFLDDLNVIDGFTCEVKKDSEMQMFHSFAQIITDVARSYFDQCTPLQQRILFPQYHAYKTTNRIVNLKQIKPLTLSNCIEKLSETNSHQQTTLHLLCYSENNNIFASLFRLENYYTDNRIKELGTALHLADERGKTGLRMLVDYQPQHLEALFFLANNYPYLQENLTNALCKEKELFLDFTDIFLPKEPKTANCEDNTRIAQPVLGLFLWKSLANKIADDSILTTTLTIMERSIEASIFRLQRLIILFAMKSENLSKHMIRLLFTKKALLSILNSKDFFSFSNRCDLLINALSLWVHNTRDVRLPMITFLLESYPDMPNDYYINEKQISKDHFIVYVLGSLLGSITTGYDSITHFEQNEQPLIQATKKMLAQLYQQLNSDTLEKTDCKEISIVSQTVDRLMKLATIEGLKADAATCLASYLTKHTSKQLEHLFLSLLPTINTITEVFQLLSNSHDKEPRKRLQEVALKTLITNQYQCTPDELLTYVQTLLDITEQDILTIIKPINPSSRMEILFGLAEKNHQLKEIILTTLSTTGLYIFEGYDADNLRKRYLSMVFALPEEEKEKKVGLIRALINSSSSNLETIVRLVPEHLETLFKLAENDDVISELIAAYLGSHIYSDELTTPINRYDTIAIIGYQLSIIALQDRKHPNLLMALLTLATQQQAIKDSIINIIFKIPTYTYKRRYDCCTLEIISNHYNINESRSLLNALFNLANEEQIENLLTQLVTLPTNRHGKTGLQIISECLPNYFDRLFPLAKKNKQIANILKKGGTLTTDNGTYYSALWTISNHYNVNQSRHQLNTLFEYADNEEEIEKLLIQIITLPTDRYDKTGCHVISELLPDYFGRLFQLAKKDTKINNILEDHMLKEDFNKRSPFSIIASDQDTGRAIRNIDEALKSVPPLNSEDSFFVPGNTTTIAHYINTLLQMPTRMDGKTGLHLLSMLPSPPSINDYLSEGNLPYFIKNMLAPDAERQTPLQIIASNKKTDQAITDLRTLFSSVKENQATIKNMLTNLLSMDNSHSMMTGLQIITCYLPEYISTLFELAEKDEKVKETILKNVALPLNQSSTSQATNMLCQQRNITDENTKRDMHTQYGSPTTPWTPLHLVMLQPDVMTVRKHITFLLSSQVDNKKIFHAMLKNALQLPVNRIDFSGFYILIGIPIIQDALLELAQNDAELRSSIQFNLSYQGHDSTKQCSGLYFIVHESIKRASSDVSDWHPLDRLFELAEKYPEIKEAVKQTAIIPEKDPAANDSALLLISRYPNNKAEKYLRILFSLAANENERNAMLINLQSPPNKKQVQPTILHTMIQYIPEFLTSLFQLAEVDTTVEQSLIVALQYQPLFQDPALKALVHNQTAASSLEALFKLTEKCRGIRETIRNILEDRLPYIANGLPSDFQYFGTLNKLAGKPADARILTLDEIPIPSPDRSWDFPTKHSILTLDESPTPLPERYLSPDKKVAAPSAQNDVAMPELEKFVINFFDSLTDGGQPPINQSILNQMETWRTQILLDNEVLCEWATAYQDSDNGNVHLSPYQTNRILMQALLIPLSQWEETLIKTLKLVSSFLLYPAKDTSPSVQALRNSYPPTFLWHIQLFIKGRELGIQDFSGISLQDILTINRSTSIRVVKQLVEKNKAILNNFITLPAIKHSHSYQGVTPLWWLCATTEGRTLLKVHWEDVKGLITANSLQAACIAEGPHQGITPLWWLCATTEGRALLAAHWKDVKGLINANSLQAVYKAAGPTEGTTPLWWLCANSIGRRLLKKHWKDVKGLITASSLQTACAGAGPDEGKTPLWWLCYSSMGRRLLNAHWEDFKGLITANSLQVAYIGEGLHQGKTALDYLESDPDLKKKVSAHLKTSSALQKHSLLSPSPQQHDNQPRRPSVEWD